MVLLQRKLIDQPPERLLASSKPVTLSNEFCDSSVVVLGVRSHYCNGSHLLHTMQLVVQVLPGLDISDQALQQRSAAVWQNSHRQAFSTALTLQPQAVPST